MGIPDKDNYPLICFNKKVSIAYLRVAGIPKLWLEIQVDAHGQIILKGLLLLHLVFISGWEMGKE